MSRMMLCGVLSWLVLFSPVPVRSDDAEDKAVAFVKELKGSVHRDDKQPGKPVVEVHFAGSGVEADPKELVKHLTQFQKLRVLDLRGVLLDDADLREVAALKGVTVLRLTPKRTPIKPYWSLITEKGVKELAALKGLVELDLNGGMLTPEMGKALAELKGLQTLRMPLRASVDGSSDEGVIALGGVTQLTTLDLNCRLVTDAGLKGLANLKNLTILNAHFGRVTDAGAKDIAGLTKLTDLDVGHNPVTDAGLKELATLKNLTRLNLDHTGVTDAGLKEVAKLGQLTDLSLAFTGVTDAGLKELAALKSLNRLKLTGTNVTAEGIAELQKALPKCKIEK